MFEEVCEILWKKNIDGKNMSLIMCTEEMVVNKTNNTIFFDELNVNLQI